MAYLVNITPRAESDFGDLFLEINASQSQAALRWYCGLKEFVLSCGIIQTVAHIHRKESIFGTCFTATSPTYTE